MSKVLGFNDFIKNEAGNVRKQVFHQKANETVWPGLYVGNYLTEGEKDWLRNYMLNRKTDISEASLMDTIKNGINTIKNSPEAQAVAKKLSSMLDSSIKFANYISDMLQRAWDKMLAYFMRKFDSVKATVKADFKRSGKGSKTLIMNARQELNDLTSTAKFWLKTVPGSMTKSLRDMLTKNVVSEALSTNVCIITDIENFDPSKLNESGLIDTLNVITKKLEHVFPFNILVKIGGLAKDGIEHFLFKFSQATAKMGGPGAFKFMAISEVGGFFIEYFIKHLSVTNVKEIISAEAILKFIPGIHHIIHTIEIVALVVAVAETIREISEEYDQTPVPVPVPVKK